jgi:hypothetical protein
MSGRAADFPCRECGKEANPFQCQGEDYLRYNHDKDQCEWPSDTECVTDEDSWVVR